MLPNEERKGCAGNFIVILSIPFLLFLALVASYFGYLSLKVELHTLLILGFIFFIFIFFIKHNANFTACKFKNSFYETEEKLKTFLNSSKLEINGKVKSLANIDEFLESEIVKLRNDNFSSVASTIFPMLGILGTFIAIAISMPNFSVQSTEALDKEISLLLSGVGTAFYASIYGIFLSLWWIFFEKRGISKINSLVEYIKRLYRKNIWTKDELERYRLLLEQESNVNIVQTLKDVFNTDMIKSLNQRYIEDFQIIVDKTSNNFEKIALDMQNATANFENSLKEMYHSENALKATIKIDETLKNFTESIDKLQNSIQSIDKSLSSSVEKNFEKVDKEIADIVVKLADFGFLLDEQIEKVFLVIEQYHKEVLKQLK
jgi:hypothetical protein